MNGKNINNTINFIKNSTDVNNVDCQIKRYWCYHSFTPGHGYVHGLKVAANAYNLAESNHYRYPKIAFTAGLLHDITRPIMDKAGQEKHAEQSGEIAERILTETNFDKVFIKEIKQAIVNHEVSFESSKNFPWLLLNIIVYLADKTDMNLERCLIYGIVSNFNSLKEKKEPPYKNINKIMKDFYTKLLNDKNTLFHIRETFPKIKGTKEAIYAYNTTMKNFTDLLKKEKGNYQSYTEITKQLTKQNILENQKFLKKINTSPKQINKIMKPFAELLLYFSTKSTFEKPLS